MDDLTNDDGDRDEEPYQYHAPNGDPQGDEDEPEPDGRWVYAHGCWLYE